MGFGYLDNMELERALSLFFEKAGQRIGVMDSEEIPVQQSLSRVTGAAVLAAISSPHYNASAMDGIVLRARDTFGATDTTPVTLQEGVHFLRVDTGDPVPHPFDAVVMIEEVIEAGEGTIRLFSAATPWQHIRQIGEDLCAGEMILPSNTRIEPAAIGAMLAGGVPKVKVRKRPVVGIIPTGDEIVAPTGNPEKGQIMEFNSSIFSAMLAQWGTESRVYGIVPDRPEQIREAVAAAAAECDLVLLNAGSSAGREDYSAWAVGQLGEVVVHGIAIKPGKPTILGWAGECPVIGVPGYPVSGIIVLEKVVKPVLDRMLGAAVSVQPEAEAVLTRKLVSSLKYREFVRVKLGVVDDRLVATPLNRGAGVVTSFVKADGLLDVPLNTEGLDAGSQVRVNLLKPESEIRNTLVVTGSHDPLIDVAADILRRKCPSLFLASSHVGSMGGITAIRRKECHAAGIHLLDEETGQYNLAYIHRYLPEEKLLLVRCVHRIQGIMTAPGNPKGINGLRDIAAGELRYVNRQKGSGTRILLDYLLKKDTLEPSALYGYEREEFTHMSVAALIASGSADAGMGIYSAAKAYGLSFIPVCEEQYDFLIPARYQSMELVARFLELLRSREFLGMLDEMGGYRTEGAGEVILL